MNDSAVSTLLDRLHERLSEGEDLELEFKAARAALPHELWPTVSAFANTRGGWIVLGVTSHKDALNVEGVANPPHLLKLLHDAMRNAQKISHPVCGADDVSIEQIGEKPLLLIRVHAAARKMRPVYINDNPYTGTYVRRHEGDYHCSKQEVDRMMREAADISVDSTILAHFSRDDLDSDSLARFRQVYQNAHPGSPFNAYDDLRFLSAIRRYRRDRESGAEGITVAGLLMFGRPEAIRDWRSRHLIDYRLLPDNPEGDMRWIDRLTFEGNLLSAFEQIYPRLVEAQPIPFQLHSGVRLDQGPAQTALREALVNLLVHADYGESLASLITRSPGGYLFRNPGNSRVQERDLWASDRSDPRNPELVTMFRLIGLAEEAGTGIPKIIEAWHRLGFRLPRIDVGTERYEFSMYLRHVHLFSNDDRVWLQTLGGGLSEAEQLALVLARQEGEVDNGSVRGLTGQHPADATKLLVGLRDRGLLQMLGSGRGARYQLAGRVPAAFRGAIAPDHAQRDSSLAIGAGSAGSDTSSVGNAGNSVGSDGSSVGNAGNSADSGQNERAVTATPHELWERLTGIAEPANGRQRLDPGALDAIIVELCRLAPLTLTEIARLTSRSRGYLRFAVHRLVGSGRLARYYPEPNHPRQKYTVVDDTMRPPENR